MLPSHAWQWYDLSTPWYVKVIWLWPLSYLWLPWLIWLIWLATQVSFSSSLLQLHHSWSCGRGQASWIKVHCSSTQCSHVAISKQTQDHSWEECSLLDHQLKLVKGVSSHRKSGSSSTCRYESLPLEGVKPQLEKAAPQILESYFHQ